MTRTGTREWSDVSLNIQVGCKNGCVYCYARQGALRRRLISRPEDWTEERLAPPEVRRARALRSARGVTMFPTTHDIHPGNVDAAIEAINLCLDKGKKVLVVTKADPEAVAKMCNALGGPIRPIAFRVTLGALDPTILRRWEPQAPPAAARIEALRLAHSMGYETSVSMEPLLEPEDVVAIVDLVRPYVTGTIWIGLLRKLDERTAWWSASGPGALAEIARLRAWQQPAGIRFIYEATRGVPGVRYKDSYREALGAQGVCVAPCREAR